MGRPNARVAVGAVAPTPSVPTTAPMHSAAIEGQQAALDTLDRKIAAYTAERAEVERELIRLLGIQGRNSPEVKAAERASLDKIAAEEAAGQSELDRIAGKG